MSNITNSNNDLLEELYGDNVDLIEEYTLGLDSSAEATSEDSDDATASYNSTDIFWRSSTDNDTNKNDTFNGGNGDDEIFGGAGNDLLSGRYGDDDIFGGSGNDTINGGAGNNDIYGGTGIDSLVYTTSLEDATITLNNNGTYTVETATSTDILKEIERIAFGGGNLALDLDASTGDAVKLIGGILGKDYLQDNDMVGVCIAYFDAGGEFAAGVDIALNFMGADTNVEIVDLLFTNILGVDPTQAQRDYYVSLIENTEMTATDLAVLACETDVNALNIDLVGLTSTGIEYKVIEWV